jgi:hypothetical protein
MLASLWTVDGPTGPRYLQELDRGVAVRPEMGLFGTGGKETPSGADNPILLPHRLGYSANTSSKSVPGASCAYRVHHSQCLRSTLSSVKAVCPRADTTRSGYPSLFRSAIAAPGPREVSHRGRRIARGHISEAPVIVAHQHQRFQVTQRRRS